jgi:glyoxylase-like metal-dependent hydrolase (beta-lactamase superfamily II)
MIEEVGANIYKIEVPLPAAFLNSMNSYVVKGLDRNLVIDTGAYFDPCFTVVQASLKKLDVNSVETDFFITHAHPDHFGLVSRLISNESTIYIGREEAEIVERMRSGAIRIELEHFIHMAGFPETNFENIFPSHVEHEYGVRERWPFRFVEDGEILGLGNYRFQTVKTPGHSNGHTCLYDAGTRILFSGDHLLRDISPSVQARCYNENPLEQYLHSLDKIYQLDVDLVLAGHGLIFKGCRDRIDQLKRHHRTRVAEILSTLARHEYNLYQIASRIPWQVEADSWNDFPELQKFFATAETFAHLEYLEGRGILRRTMQGPWIVYSLPHGRCSSLE